MNPGVELREYIEAKIKHERELRQQAEIEARRALDLQTAELARRLHDLNNAHARAVEQAATFLPRELFEAYARVQGEMLARRDKDDQVWKASVMARLDEERGAQGRQQAILYAVVAIASIINVILRFIP